MRSWSWIPLRERVLVAVALLASLVLQVGSAQAIGVSITGVYSTTTPFPQLSDTVTVEVYLDASDNPVAGITLFSVGVAFDPLTYAYDQESSSSASYLLYQGPGVNYLVASSTCGGPPGGPTAGEGCDTWPFDDYQVNIDFNSNNLPYGANGTKSGVPIATLVFHVTDFGVGPGSIYLVFDDQKGNILQYGTGAFDTPTLTGVVSWAPEPSLAALTGVGLVGLALLGALRERGR